MWIPDPEDGYVEAEITSTKADMVVVNCKHGEVGDTATSTHDSSPLFTVQRTLKKDLVQEMNPPKYEKTEDMSNLTFLNVC